MTSSTNVDRGSPRPLPFLLRVPGSDAFSLSVIGSTRYHFSGLLQPGSEAFDLEWTGTAEVDEVGLAGIRSERLSLPLESLRLPYAALRAIELRGGWLRPHIDLTAARLDALRSVPSEAAGLLHLWLARRDRVAGQGVVAFMRDCLARSGGGHQS